MSQLDTLTGWIAAALFGAAIGSSLVNRWRLSAGRSFSMGWFRAHNWLGAVALGHSAEEFLQLGVHNVWQRILSLRSRLADGLVDLGFPLIAGASGR